MYYLLGSTRRRGPAVHTALVLSGRCNRDLPGRQSPVTCNRRTTGSFSVMGYVCMRVCIMQEFFFKWQWNVCVCMCGVPSCDRWTKGSFSGMECVCVCV